MLTINPYLFFNGNCRQTFLFYKSVFEKDEFLSLETFGSRPQEMKTSSYEENKNKIMHIALSINEHSTLMGCDIIEETEESGNPSISINNSDRKEAEKIFTKLSEGGKILIAFEKSFWGDHFGMLLDKFSIRWMLNYHC